MDNRLVSWTPPIRNFESFGTGPSALHTRNTQGAHEGGVGNGLLAGVKKLGKLSEETIKKRRLKEYQEIFQEIPEKTLKLVDKLIKMAVNMEINIQKLEAELKEVGFVEKYQNGENQSGTKESTVSRSYSTMVKNYTQVIRTLLACLPEEKQKSAEDNLAVFLQSRK